jgi:hypothetical protein
MPSEFDTLVQQLKLIQDGQPADEPLRKAMPAGTGAPMPGLPDLKHLGKQCDLLAKSLRTPKVAQAPRRKLTEGEQFLKSLASIKYGNPARCGRWFVLAGSDRGT